MNTLAPSKRKRFKNAYRSGDFGPMHLRKGRMAALFATNMAVILTVPAGVTAVAGSLSAVLAWTPQSNVWKYQIDKSPDGTTAWTLAGEINAAGNASVYGGIITGLTAAVIQYFRVRAVNANNVATANSANVSATPTA